MEAKERPVRPTRRRGIASTPTRPLSRKALIVIVISALLGIGALVAGYLLLKAIQFPHHAYPISWPQSAPTGAPVKILHEVKAADVFTTVTVSNASIVLAVDTIDPKQAGTKLDVTYTTTHAIEPRDGGLTSNVSVKLERADSSYAPARALLWAALGGAKASNPYGVTFQRDPAGRPVPGTVTETGKPAQRFVLDGVVCGLGDLATNWLPDRDVRVGEVWPMESCARTPNVAAVIKQVAEAKGDDGYPTPTLRAEVAAEGIEFKDTEKCLRLRLVLSFQMEGDAKAPAVPGWISTAAFVDGHVWVSVETGLPWASELESGITSSYATAHKTEERRAVQKIASKTVRGPQGVSPTAK